MNNKIWVVTYYDIGETEPTVTCFNNEENAMKYYECEAYTKFEVYE